MDLGLADARVLVTGGASNIGRGIVHAFAAEGARIVIADIDGPQAERVRAEAGKLGAAEVRATFPLAKGFVAGCLVTEGKINRGAAARLRRGKEVVHEGKVDTLKRFKDDANEVRAGLECGIKLDDFNGYQVGDVIECFTTEKVAPKLP